MAVRAVNVLSICSGVGMLDLGVKLAVPAARTVCYLEREAYCVEILATRMRQGFLDDGPVWSSLETFDGKAWRGLVDLVIAGLPCQPYSVAGQQRGHEDERAIWPAFMRIIGDVQPELVFLENVPAFVQYFRPIGDALHGLGYRFTAGLFSADEVGASQKRVRFFCLATRSWRDPDGMPRGGPKGEDWFNSSLRDSLADASTSQRGRKNKGWRTAGRVPSGRAGGSMGRPDWEEPDQERTWPCQQCGKITNHDCRFSRCTLCCERLCKCKRVSDFGTFDEFWDYLTGIDPTLDDASRHGGSGPHGPSGSGRGVRETGEPVGNTEQPRANADAERRGPRGATGEPGGPVAVTSSEIASGLPSGTGTEFASSSSSSSISIHGNPSRELGDAESSGPFPPGPGDRERWAAILAERPWLAPATQPGVRGLVAGDSVVVDLARVDQLRALGNGVVPLCAAKAFVVLSGRLSRG